MSFDNVLFDNMEAEPVLMQPLDFPLDDKQALPQVGRLLYIYLKQALTLPTILAERDSGYLA